MLLATGPILAKAQQLYQAAIRDCPSWAEAWHSLALLDFRALRKFERESCNSSAISPHKLEVLEMASSELKTANEELHLENAAAANLAELSQRQRVASLERLVVQCATDAVKGFFKSIRLVPLCDPNEQAQLDCCAG